MTLDNDAHAARRKVLDKALPPRDHSFREINMLAQRFVATLVQESGKPCEDTKGWSGLVDVTPVATWFTFDLISVIAFGESFDMLRSRVYRWLPGCLQSASIFLYWGGYAPGLNFWRWLLSTSLPSLLRLTNIVESQRYTDFVGEVVDRRAKRLEAEEKGEESRRSDIFRHLLSVNLYSDLDLRADISLLVAAGSDAIRLIVVATLFYWLKHPAIFGRAVDEIRSSTTSAEDVSEATLSSLKYLRACIDETMRLCPLKAASLPREVKKRGMAIDGIFVPEGMTVGVSMYAIHHDSEIYPDPYAYKPERWLEHPQDPRMRAAFCPFLKGPRACPGQTVAYFAMQLALFHLLQRCDVRISGGNDTSAAKSDAHKKSNEKQYEFKDWILGFGHGPVVELKKRVPPWYVVVEQRLSAELLFPALAR